MEGTGQQQGVNGESKEALAAYEPKSYLGKISEIAEGELTFEFEREVHDSGNTVASNVEVGSFLVASVRGVGILGKLKTISKEIDQAGNPSWLGRITFTHSFQPAAGKVVAGIISSPRINDKVFIANPKLMKLAAEAGSLNEDGEPLTVSIAQMQDKNKTPLRFTPEMIFGRHTAVLGATGGGKSWTVAKMVEETSKLRSKMILFDATGEYGNLRNGIHHVFLGNHPSPTEFTREVVVPYSELTERDLFAIFKPKGQAQAPKLRAAIKSLKLAEHAPSLAIDGTIMKANRSKGEYERAYREFYHQVEDEKANFDITQLARQIEHECVRPNRSAMEPQFWGDVSAVDIAQCTSLINRVRDIVGSENLAPIFNPSGKPSLLRVIDAFLEDESARVLCVSLQYLSFAHHTREIVANACGRHLLTMSQRERFRRKPLVVLVDEAHQFLNTKLTDSEGDYPLDSFSLIAKEGRKYGLSICLATQRPRDIPESVLSQMGSMIIHRLINDKDRAVVERASGEMDTSSLEALPALGPGEAVVLGASFTIPLRVQIIAPETPPNSRGPDYQKFWNF